MAFVSSCKLDLDIFVVELWAVEYKVMFQSLIQY